MPTPSIRVAVLALVFAAPALHAQSLRGSPRSVANQRAVAERNDLSFLNASRDVTRFVDLGLLVPLRGNASYRLVGVSYPYARPAVRLFVERLSSQYQSACGEQLVVTSLTRPESRQPRNASDESVHPTGIAVDLRVSLRTACRSWLTRTLLELEKGGLLEATRENRPAHFHVAVFPRAYEAYVERKVGTVRDAGS